MYCKILDEYKKKQYIRDLAGTALGRGNTGKY